MSETTICERDKFTLLTKHQLIDYIEQQKEQLIIFENRFRDVVRAYKGILKEKEALETSLKALSVSMNQSLSESNDEYMCDKESNNDLSLEESSNKGVEYITDRDQVAMLTQSINVLTEEKAKTEFSFQQDKKNLLIKLEAANIQLMEQSKKFTEETIKLQEQYEELKNKLEVEKKAKIDEESVHEEMMKELQHCLNLEKEKYETLHQQLKKSELIIFSCEKEKGQEFDDQVHQLTKELAEVRAKFEKAEVQSREPSPFVLKLQEEMLKIKLDHEKLLEDERNRANESEIKLSIQAKIEEDKVASLEQKLSELSDIIGKYDRQREQDQQVILKLKERVSQLDLENAALAKAHFQNNTATSNDMLDQLVILQEKVSKLRQLLKLATQKILTNSQLPTNLEDMSVAEYTDLLAKELFRKDFQQEVSQLQHEFESYKKKAQLVLKSKSDKEYESNKEVHELQEKCANLGLLVERLQKESDDNNENYLVSLQKLREDIRQKSDKHAYEMMQAEHFHKQKLQELQQHVLTTRNRMKDLLEEKEKEIAALRESLNTHSIVNSNLLSESTRMDPNGGGVIDELFEKCAGAGDDSEVKMLLYVQEKQRISNEIQSLRKKKLELEDLLRDLTEREQRHIEQNMLLKQEINKLERDRSRETENLEYLKNIIFHFMCSDFSGQQQLIIPISTVLHFTPKEISSVKKKFGIH